MAGLRYTTGYIHSGVCVLSGLSCADSFVLKNPPVPPVLPNGCSSKGENITRKTYKNGCFRQSSKKYSKFNQNIERLSGKSHLKFFLKLRFVRKWGCSEVLYASESFKYCFLTSCILIGVHTSPLDRSFDKENGGAKGRKEGKSGRWEIHSEDVYVQYCRYNTKMEGYYALRIY